MSDFVVLSTVFCNAFSQFARRDARRPGKPDNLATVRLAPVDRPLEACVRLVAAHHENVEVEFLYDFVHVGVDDDPVHRP